MSSPCYFGPYTTVCHVGLATYEVTVLETTPAHPIFHMSLLCPAHGQFSSSLPVALAINEEWKLSLGLEKVVTLLGFTIWGCWCNGWTILLRKLPEKIMICLFDIFNIFALRTRRNFKGVLIRICHFNCISRERRNMMTWKTNLKHMASDTVGVPIW